LKYTKFAERNSVDGGDDGTRLSPLYLLLYSPPSPVLHQPAQVLVGYHVVIINIHVDRRAGRKLERNVCEQTEEIGNFSSIDLYNTAVVRIKWQTSQNICNLIRDKLIPRIKGNYMNKNNNLFFTDVIQSLN
jgi:hypothetical protein